MCQNSCSTQQAQPSPHLMNQRGHSKAFRLARPPATGFRPGHGTETALIASTDSPRRAVDRGRAWPGTRLTLWVALKHQQLWRPSGAQCWDGRDEGSSPPGPTGPRWWCWETAVQPLGLWPTYPSEISAITHAVFKIYLKPLGKAASRVAITLLMMLSSISHSKKTADTLNRCLEDSNGLDEG